MWMTMALLLVVTAPLMTGAQAAADPVTLQLPADAQTVNLGTSRDIPITVTASADFDGTVSLGFDISELSQSSPDGKVEVSVTPQMLRLAPNQTKSATIQVKTDSMAPSFSSVKLGVNAQAVTPTTASVVSGPVLLTVQSIFEIRLSGGPEPEVWDSPKSVSFAPHAEGVLVRFINADTRDSHVIHSTGPIPHGDTGNPLQPAGAQGQDGGIYEYRVTGSQKMKDIYYCHVHEDGKEARTLLFNQ
jgi:hypothetical protein